MTGKITERLCQSLLLVMLLLTGAATGCAPQTPRLYAPMQPDGWSAQPVVPASRFAPDADLDPATGTPIGDEGYFLYILTEAVHWDFGDAASLVLSIRQRPWAHGWLILESPRNRLEFGLTGNFGRERPRYHEGVLQRVRDGDVNPIGYLWQTMSDGQLQTGKPSRFPTFVWRMPITRRRYQLIHEYVMQRKYSQFGLRTDNCTDLVGHIAAVAGIKVIYRIRLTLPPELKVGGRTVRLWTDPQYRILEFGAVDVLEVDLRQLAQMGIGGDAD